jgi:hypothetical protein
MAAKQLSTEWLTFRVPLPEGRLTTRSIDQTVAMAAARLRWTLGQRHQQEIRERAIARCAANDARKAARAAGLEAAGRRAVAEEAADLRDKAEKRRARA